MQNMDHIQVNQKLRMERIRPSMAPVIYQTIEHDRSYLSRWLPFVAFTKKEQDTEKFILSIVGQKGKRRDDVYSIWYNEKFAGLIGFKETDWINQKTELGYWLAKKMQGKGIMTVCVQTLLQFAFQKLGMNRVQIKVARENKKSAAIPQKLNFSFEGTEREGEKHEDTWLDLDVYSLLRKDRKNPENL